MFVPSVLASVTETMIFPTPNMAHSFATVAPRRTTDAWRVFHVA